MIGLAILWVVICALALIEEQRHGRYNVPTKVSIKWALYDPWIGFFHDRANSVLYFCPLPCVLIKFDFSKKVQDTAVPATHLTGVELDWFVESGQVRADGSATPRKSQP